MEEFKMPEEMTIEERPEEVTAASVILGEVKTQEEKVKEWLDEVYATKLKQRPGIGVVNEGVIDDEYLAKVKARAAQTILENITKLYKTKVKKVAIVGTAMSYKEAPYGDPSWEIWGLNDHWNLLPRATRWFESQSEEHCAATNCTNGTGLPRMEWYRKAPIPVYMPDHYASAPMSIKYPLREIQAWLSEVDPQGFNYFTNTVSFMIALALYEGFDIIHLFGVDMAVGSEYEKQRPSCEFFLGIAKGLKVELYIPEQADLLKCMERYGMRQPGEEHKKDAFMKKMDDRREYQRSQLKKCEEQIKQRQDEIQRLSATMFKYQGCLEDVDQTLKVWGQI